MLGYKNIKKENFLIKSNNELENLGFTDLYELNENGYTINGIIVSTFNYKKISLGSKVGDRVIKKIEK
jgi:hypothetical protein